jgi:hypothetical protein
MKPMTDPIRGVQLSVNHCMGGCPSKITHPDFSVFKTWCVDNEFLNVKDIFIIK